MEYKCVDAGSRRCPCVLMEAGQCYMCTMSRTGKCGCGAEWEGACPYTEYVFNGLKTDGLLRPFRARVSEIVCYSEQLKVVRLAVPAGFAQRCRVPGSYVLVESLGCKVPLSVLRSRVRPGDDKGGFVEFAVQPAGPKTIDILRPDTEEWLVSGPFEAGLCGAGRLRPEKPLLVVAKGTAIAPYINIADRIKARLLVDGDKLSEDFLRDYTGGYEPVNLSGEMERVATATDNFRQIMFLASPYYTEKILEMRPDRKDDIITANHANICCGVGICGACSYTDKDGVTVRRCKCEV